MVSKASWYLSTALIAAGLVAHAGGAQAAGFALKEQSAEAQGASYAGAGARADDPSSMFYNPAGITQLPGIQVSGSIAGIMPNGTLANGAATTGKFLGNMPYAGTTGTNSGVDAAVPSIYISAQLSDSLFAGFALTSPYGLATKYPSSSIARYYALTTDLKTMNFGPILAYKITPQLSIGGGVNIETAEAHLSNAMDFGSIAYAQTRGASSIFGLTPGTNTGSATLHGTDTAVGWNVGVLYKVDDTLRIGAAYRSAMYHNISGSVAYGGVPALLAANFTAIPASAKVPEPATANLSVAKDIGKWTLLGDLTYTGWSVFQNLSVYSSGSQVTTTTENFKDTIGVAAGADYRYSDQLTLRGGVAWDPTPVQNAYRTPRIADNDRFWVSVGATWRPTPNWAISGAYSHLFANNDTVNLTDLGPGTANQFKGNLMATYNVSVDIVSAQVTYKF